MPKQIVAKTEIATDAKLALVKLFRTTNKRAGEARRAEDPAEFNRNVEKLQELAEKAESLGFHIWVNGDGKTGHTYEKDYRPTDDDENDWDTHLQELRDAMAQQEQIIAAALSTLHPNHQNN